MSFDALTISGMAAALAGAGFSVGGARTKERPRDRH
jgi:hypothetical protein